MDTLTPTYCFSDTSPITDESDSSLNRNNRPRKRRWSSISSNDSVSLHISSQNSEHSEFSVSNWTLRHVERLNISYASEYLEDPFDLFEKIGRQINPLSDLQRKYTGKVKSLLNFDANGPENRQEIYTRDICSDLNHQIIDQLETLKVENKTCSTDNKDIFVDSMAKIRAFDFILELSNILKFYKNIYQLMKYHVAIATEESGKLYVPMISKLAELCQLRAESGKGRRSQWLHLLDNDVYSEPDLRLYKKGMSLVDSVVEGPDTCVTVTAHQRNFCQRLNETHSKRSINETIIFNEDIQSPRLLQNLNESILGKHAGELLLDIRSNGLRKKNGDTNELIILGTIIDGTKIYLTVLEMTETHCRKLERQDQLTDTDRACIHYVKPFDIIFEEERNMLIECLMHLNNIHQ
ncbi:unnamed protein product [Mytilus coruscus]|uniref:Uncharacterized protein n=1 Tax=Mytilus coruscus TaxID=42192 RepID=A0A6J8EC85_MYTCO|nr:unnamed protein product [Mytilus coruscus]